MWRIWELAKNSFATGRVMELNEFKVYFTNMDQPWYFAKPYDTTKLLRKIGYVNTKVHLHNDMVIMTNREIYSRFVKTVD